MTWREVHLGDHIDLLVGPAFKSSLFTNNSDDVPLVKGENIGQGRILWEKSKFWSRENLEKYEKYFLDTNDVILAMDRPWVPAGLKYAYIKNSDPQALLVQRVARMKGVNGLDTVYLRYIIASPEFAGYVKNIMGGTNVPHISANQIKSFKVQIPPLKTQNKIADILSKYDDLIENNRRRIELLEESARLLYREWFVHLRFPGHEHTPIIDGIPEGWEIKKIEDICKTIGGGTPSTKNPEYWNDGNITWVTPTDVTKNNCLALLDSEKKITELGLKKSSAKLVPPETILMTSRASVGFFALMDREVCTNQGFISIVPYQDDYRMYLLHNLMQRVEEIRSHAGGSTYREINKTRFRNFEILIPSNFLLKQFQDQAYKILQQVRLLNKQNQKLSQARDLLLPRLMNGEITV
jgi:type I restriction enzyme S subunit